MDAPPPGTPPLYDLARQLRDDTWAIAEQWAAHGVAAPTGPPNGDEAHWERFGEIPAFLAALAHHLERCPATGDAVLAAARSHAHNRVLAQYTQRELLLEFVALRRVLIDYCMQTAVTPEHSVRAQGLIHSLLDAVIVETTDTFFEELTRNLARRAERDALTGLTNRETFHRRFTRELTRARRHGHELTVVVLDLDGFKQVNDSLGHLAGDAVLQRIGELLETHTRDEDIVGRLGGDEFAVVLVEATADAARDLIRRLRIHLIPARRQLGLPPEFGISYGAATFPHQGTTPDELLFAADSGMYAHKGAGRGERMHEAGHAPTVGKVSVLVADDDAGVRLLCATALEEQGFEVTTTPTGPAAIACALRNPPDVAVLDVSMPGCSGWAVAEALAANPHTRAVPVVMMTGRIDQEHLDRADSSGAIAFLPKPCEPGAVIRCVNEVLEHTHHSTPDQLRASA